MRQATNWIAATYQPVRVRRGSELTLVNWNGSAIFGQGSEWFWAFAQFLVVVVSLAGIYHQLRMQGATNALQRIESLQAYFSSERMDYLKLAVAIDLKGGQITTATWAKARPILDFLSNLEDLHHHGYVTIAELVDNWGRPLEVWDALLKPLVERQRSIEGVEEMYDFTRLLVAVRKEFRRRGIPALHLGDDERAKWLDFIVENHTANLRLHQELRAGAIPGGELAPTPLDASKAV
jgi:GNAT superfamily N-acetyltransferase